MRTKEKAFHSDNSKVLFLELFMAASFSLYINQHSRPVHPVQKVGIKVWKFITTLMAPTQMVIKRIITAYSLVFLTMHFWSGHGQFYLVRFCFKIVSFSHDGVSISSSSLYCIDATTAVLFTLILPRKALKVELWDVR